jgi:hypothetical protein
MIPSRVVADMFDPRRTRAIYQGHSVRLTNLISVLRELEVFGLRGLRSKAEFLEVSEDLLRSMLLGQHMTDGHARFLESQADKPLRWMDVDHSQPVEP